MKRKQSDRQGLYILLRLGVQFAPISATLATRRLCDCRAAMHLLMLRYSLAWFFHAEWMHRSRCSRALFSSPLPPRVRISNAPPSGRRAPVGYSRTFYPFFFTLVRFFKFEQWGNHCNSFELKTFDINHHTHSFAVLIIANSRKQSDITCD